MIVYARFLGTKFVILFKLLLEKGAVEAVKQHCFIDSQITPSEID